MLKCLLPNKVGSRFVLFPLFVQGASNLPCVRPGCSYYLPKSSKWLKNHLFCVQPCSFVHLTLLYNFSCFPTKGKGKVLKGHFIACKSFAFPTEMPWVGKKRKEKTSVWFRFHHSKKHIKSCQFYFHHKYYSWSLNALIMKLFIPSKKYETQLGAF